MRLKPINARDPGQKQVMIRDYTYQYDDLYRLTQSVNLTLPDEAYTYDKLGNRLTSASTIGEWSYNANNELLTTDNTQFSYDFNGSMIQKNVDDDIKNYIYDVEDRLVRVVDGDNNVTHIPDSKRKT